MSNTNSENPTIIDILDDYLLAASPLTSPFFRSIISINKPAVGLLKRTKMARIVNKEEYELRRNEILNAAQMLVYSKGYDQMSIQDILAAVHISKGAFYHYFDSKQALLEALIERLALQVIKIITPIVQDDRLPATEKLRRVFDMASRWKTDRKEYLIKMVNVWYADENAVLRQKAQSAVLPLIAPLLTTIFYQGVREGVFHTEYPDQISGIIFSLLQELWRYPRRVDHSTGYYSGGLTAAGIIVRLPPRCSGTNPWCSAGLITAFRYSYSTRVVPTLQLNKGVNYGHHRSQ